MIKIKRNFFLKLFLITFILAVFFALIIYFSLFSYAADGSGTNIISPNSVNAGSTGNTLTFNFTSAEAMNSGEITIIVPSTWSAPQGTNGVAGYTTATSTGIIADVKDNLDSVSNWAAQTGACNAGLLTDSTTFHEGAASLLCQNSGATNNTKLYRNFSVAENWSGYTNVGFWIRASANLSSSQYKFSYAANTNLGTPIASLNLPAITANTWTFVNLTLTGVRTSVLSFGFQIAGASAQNNNINIDDILLGPGILSFPGSGIISARLLTLAGSAATTITYGFGGGTSGAVAPSAGEISIFTTQSRASDSGTLTNIASSPTVSVNNPSPTTTSISPASATAGGSAFTLTVNGANFNSSSIVQWNGSSRTTTFVNSTQIIAAINASDIASVGTFAVMVFNPTPGGGTSNSQTFTVNAAPDTTSPTITAFTMPATATSLVVNVNSFTATDSIGVVGYLITEASSTPLASDLNWSGTAPTSFTFSGSGLKTAYAWAKDSADNISTSLSANVTITLPDSTPPIVSAFTIPSTSDSLAVNISSFTATDNTGVAGYLLTETSTTPSAGTAGWAGSAPTSYIFSSDGVKTLYAWAKDASGNVSTSLNALVTITLTVPSGGAQSVSSVTTSVGGASQSSAVFSGQAYPGVMMSVLRKLVSVPEYEGASVSRSVINDDGTFELTLEYFQQADWLFALQAKDKDGKNARVLAFSQFIPGGSIFKIENIFIPPTIDLSSAAVTKGKNLSVAGYAAPSAKIEAFINGKKVGENQSDVNGKYSVSVSTNSLVEGNYFVKTRYIISADKYSDFSESKAFLISSLIYPKADFNSDGRVTVTDWSVFLYRWWLTDQKLRITIDLNSDGKIDISDFSVFLQAMK